MIWQAICSRGNRNTPFVTTGTINGQEYIKECLQKRLLPLLRSHNGPTLFWPDFASCHYSKDVLEWYKANEVNFVPKDFTPPNAPELRPTEKYWAFMKFWKHPEEVQLEEDMKKKWISTQKKSWSKRCTRPYE